MKKTINAKVAAIFSIVCIEQTSCPYVYLCVYLSESLMHYGENAFAKDRSLKTIVPLIPNSNMGQRRGLSVVSM